MTDVAVTDTLGAVAPQHRGILTDADQARIRAAMESRDAADAELRDAVRTASKHGASVRELAAFTGMSTNTISRWRAES